MNIRRRVLVADELRRPSAPARFGGWCGALLGLWLGLPLGHAAAQAVAALRPADLIPGDVALAVQANRPWRQVERLGRSDLGQRWKEFAPVRKWFETDLPMVRFILGQIASRLDMKAEELESWVIDGRWAVAVRPWEEGEAEPGWLVLLEAPDAAVLERGLAGLRKAAADSGEFRQGKGGQRFGVDFHQGTFDVGERRTEVFLSRTERFAVLTNREELLERVLALGLGRRQDSLAARLVPEDRLVPADEAFLEAWWLPGNMPNQWAAWREQTLAGDRHARPLVDLLDGLVLGARSISARLRVGDEVRLDVLVRPLDDRTPVWAPAAEAGPPSAALQRVPADYACLVFGKADLNALFGRMKTWTDDKGRLEAARFLRAAVAFAPEIDFETDLLANVARDWAVGLRFLPDARWDVFAVAAWAESQTDPAPLSEMLEGLIHSVGSGLTFAHNLQLEDDRRTVAWTRGLRDGHRWFRLHGKHFPGGMQPTVFVAPGRLLLSVTGWSDPLDRRESAVDPRQFPWLKHPVAGQPTAGFGAVVLADSLLAGLRERREPLRQWVVQDRKVPAEEAKKGWRRLEELLALADTAWTAAGADRAGLWIGLGIGTKSR